MENGGELKKGGKLAAAAVIAGIVIGSISSLVAYEVTYEGVGPGPDDDKGGILITLLIVWGVISAIVLVFMGSVAFWAPGLSGQEVTGFSEVHRKRP